MKTTEFDYFNEETGESFFLEIDYEYVPYTPARITADPEFSEPENGDYCEDMDIRVVGYEKYDDQGDLVVDKIAELSEEEAKELTKRFNKMVDDSEKLYLVLEEACRQDIQKYEYDGE